LIPSILFIQPQIPYSEVPSRVAQGIYFRDDGEVIPGNLLEETVEAFYDFGNYMCPAKREEDEKKPESVGDALDAEFEYWAQCYKAFYSRNLRMLLISCIVCPWKAFLVLLNKCM
jgi:hypothetical protein